MDPKRRGLIVAALLLSSPATVRSLRAEADAPRDHESVAMAQVPSWSNEDLDFSLHGTMSTEVVPETVLRAFIRIYPDLFPTADLSHLGLIPDAKFGWPVGFSRRQVPHLGGLSAVGVNCAACHVTDITSAQSASPIRVLGVASLFDAEVFFGSVIVSTFRTADPANMKKFLAAWLTENDPSGGAKAQEKFASEWGRQEEKITSAIKDDPSGAKNAGPGGLQQINSENLLLNSEALVSGMDLAALTNSTLKLFHNMRTALHVPDQPPEKAPPASGPGRDDAFGLLSAGLFGAAQPYAPVKFGLVWNVDKRHWVHWDGNTQSPLGRNLLASLGLGAPLIGKHGELDFTKVKHQTDLSDHIRAPRYPFAVDRAVASRGAAHFEARCASCHTGPEGDQRLYSLNELGTDPHRAEAFSPSQAARFNKFFAELETAGYKAPKEPPIRSTGKYWAASLDGIWARSPYLHNGSVRTMQDLLTPPATRAKTFHRGTHAYDATQMGYTDDGAFVLDTAAAGNANSGHDYGTNLSPNETRELIEYLKTL